MQQIAIGFIVFVVQLIVAIVLSAGTLYTGIGLLDRLTPGIDEWKQIKKGNLAVGIFYATAMFSLIILVAPLIEEFISYLVLPLQPYALLMTFINYLLALLAGTVIIFLTINVIDRLTHDLEEMEQLEKGNVAVALIMSVVLLSVVYIASFPLESAFDSLRCMESLV